MPVEVTATNPLTFRHDDGRTETFRGYRFDEDSENVRITRPSGCAVYPVGTFNHNASIDIYSAVAGK